MRKTICLAILISLGAAAPAQQVGVSRPAITGIAFIGLVAQSLPADRGFYENMLGWTAAPSIEFTGGLRFYGVPRQWIEVIRAKSPDDPPLNRIAFATSHAAQLRVYLAQHGVTVPETTTRWKDGSQSFCVRDPEGNTVEFVQLGPLHLHATPNPRAISLRIIHAGFLVHSASVEDAFYQSILGFHLYWKGGMKDGATDFIAMQVPNGTDWIEYMLNVPPHSSHREMGVVDHFSLGVADINSVVSKLSQRGWKPSPASHKQMGRDGKYQLNVYDPDDIRIEFMQFQPSQRPCCSPFMGPHPKPD